MTYDPMSSPSGASATGSESVGSTSGASVAGTSGNDPANQSVGQLLAGISTDLSTLMRQELELAKVELKEEGVKAGKAAGMLGAAGYLGHLAVLFLSLALWWLIATIINSPGWAFLIVGLLYAIGAGILGMQGKKKVQEVNPKPEQTVDTLQEVPGALKPSN